MRHKSTMDILVRNDLHPDDLGSLLRCDNLRALPIAPDSTGLTRHSRFLQEWRDAHGP
ncbi:MAG: hypothetical protein R3C45_09240 [Phycisphaerales bacterium]